MRVLVVSEGKHEQSGALKNLLNRLGGEHHDLSSDRMARSDLPRPRVHGGKGYFKKALGWILQAEKEGYDALILLMDEDDEKKRVQEIREVRTTTYCQTFHELWECLFEALTLGCWQTKRH